MLRPRKKLFVAGGLVAGMMASGIAWAAWTAEGTGSGYAKATEAQDLTTSAVAATADLFPGATGDVKITINNPNPYPVEVTSISNGIGGITSDDTGCTAANNGVTFTDQTGTWAVGANGSQTFTLADAVDMDNSSVDACQGATFTIPVALSGASDA